jgi:hypothetical protein
MQTGNTSLEKLVEQLLHHHECVILPDFGGFIVRDSPCNFNASKDVLKPFAKHIFFNPHLIQNDGLLVSEIQKSESLNYNEALDFCKSEIEELRNDIEQNDHKSFGKLGTFHKGLSNVWFAPSSSLNLSVDSYGLGAINIVHIHSISELNEDIASDLKEKTSEVVPDKTPIVSLEIPKRGLKPWLVAASVALLAHFIYLGVENKTSSTQKASILPSLEVVEPSIEVPSETIIVEAEDSTSSLEIPRSEIAVIESEPIVETIPEPVVSNPVQQTPIIATENTELEIKHPSIARYRIEGNANFHVADLIKKGQKAQVEHNGIWYEVKIVQ